MNREDSQQRRWNQVEVHQLSKVDENKHAVVNISGEFPTKFDQDTFVLMIDDDLAFIASVKESLEPLGAKVILALNGQSGVEKFYSMRPQFVFINVELSDMTGFQVLDQIKETAKFRQMGIMMMGANPSKEHRMQAYERGAIDFLRKPFDLDVFTAYLLNRDALHKKVEESVARDSLTGVGNRLHFDEMMTDFAEMEKYKGTPFSLAMLDLDHFKLINDSYGHLAGDKVLKKLGEVALKVKGKDDFVFRYGGEEFALLQSGGTVEKGALLLERIRKEFNEIIFQENDESFSVTFSSGVAAYAGDIDQLIYTADQALYEAKRNGRNQTVIYNVGQEEVKRKLTIIIVDDDVLIRTILYDLLISWELPDIDISVVVYPDGLSFLEADWYHGDGAFIVLLDGVMPGIEGLEVLRRLKVNYDKSNVLVAMMTARTKGEDIRTAFELGAADYFIKPFNHSVTLRRIQQLASRLLT